MPTEGTPKVLVVGGSVGGLAVAIGLRKLGYNVQVCERSSNQMQGRGGGVVIQEEILEFFQLHGLGEKEDIGVRLNDRQTLARDGSVEWRMSMGQWMTSWDMLYRKMKDAFPSSAYHLGWTLKSVENLSNEVKATFANGMKLKTDLLVACDGIGSTVRKQLFPEAKAEYAGYVAWRGLLEEEDVEPQVLKVLENNFTFFHGQEMQCLAYMVPGADGELEEGKRRINWLWYFNVPKEQLEDLMTSKSGNPREFFLPSGELQAKYYEKQEEIARASLPPQFLHLFLVTQAPFVQPIFDVEAPAMVQGRVALLGDAAFSVRPHTAAGTSKALANAMVLAQYLQNQHRNIPDQLKKWGPKQRSYEQYLADLGKRLGAKSGLGHGALGDGGVGEVRQILGARIPNPSPGSEQGAV